MDNPLEPPQRPAPHTDTVPPSPRGHVLPELVQDEAGLVSQLAGRDTVGTERAGAGQAGTALA